MSRRTEREAVFKLIFRREFNSEEEMKDQLAYFFDDNEESGKLSEEEQKKVEDRYELAASHMEEIDEIISSNAEGWNISRMGKVELAIIRLAVFEMRFDEDIPELVAIDEAVELAKKFGGDQAPSFINGVLARIVPKTGEEEAK
ncbi:MAG: transcription antitermination factor NusB [Lachnospiraceae bacterium]|nr:transcription antitermination factor NusB [Lachnospiraceae bacterium]